MTYPGPKSFPDALIDRIAPYLVWGLWSAMSAAALATGIVAFRRQHASPHFQEYLGLLANAALPCAGAFAFIHAVHRVRHRVRIADAFFPLVLLNPLLFARSGGPFDSTLMAAGLLALMAGVIIAMKHTSYFRCLVVAALALALARLSDIFIMLLPPLVAWLLTAAYSLAVSAEPARRTAGFAVMAAAEIALLVFALACILVDPTSAPHPATLFSTIVSFSEFPLLVLCIVMLALGWRATGGAHARFAGTGTPPYFWGMLALLVGLLAMLIINFQAGKLPPPGADQTALILCLLYTVSALHGPRRLHYLLPPLLLAVAIAYTILR
jgi:hypothetical protein